MLKDVQLIFTLVELGNVAPPRLSGGDGNVDLVDDDGRRRLRGHRSSSSNLNPVMIGQNVRAFSQLMCVRVNPLHCIFRRQII
ncbi:hypothetical protein BLOT_016236 [Blomia tropicalis]|nr:hypothetical protein BLOT_016236 [Blomia tropicalis]